MDNTEKKLRKLFDFQRFEKEPGLQSVIDSVKQGRSGGYKLSDEDLEFAAGGVANVQGEDPQAYGRCTVAHCGCQLSKTSFGYVCSAGHCLDKNKKYIGDMSSMDKSF